MCVGGLIIDGAVSSITVRCGIALQGRIVAMRFNQRPASAHHSTCMAAVLPDESLMSLALSTAADCGLSINVMQSSHEAGVDSAWAMLAYPCGTHLASRMLTTNHLSWKFRWTHLTLISKGGVLQ